VLATSAQWSALTVRQFHRRAVSSPKRRLGASEIVAEFVNKNSRGGSYEVSSYDCHFSGINRHNAGNVASGRLLQGQRKMLLRQML
jgi:hypothetical protein